MQMRGHGGSEVFLATFPNRPDPLTFLRERGSDAIILLQTQAIYHTVNIYY